MALWQRPRGPELFYRVMASTLAVVFILGSLTERHREGLRGWLKRRWPERVEAKPRLKRLPG